MRRGVHMAKRKRRAFTAGFKADAVKHVREGGRTIPQVARDLDLTETALRKCVKQAVIDAGQGPSDAQTSAERAKLTQLRRDVKRLEMEWAIPRNATACFVRESK